MKVYLDICAIQRPLDTANQARIMLEAEAVLGLVTLCDAGQLELVSSEALIYETEQNPLPVRREHAFAILGKAQSVVTVDKIVKDRAEQFIQQGIKPLDSLHLALAEASQVDNFCTCDDQLFR
jgi:hypothetical protein